MSKVSWPVNLSWKKNIIYIVYNDLKYLLSESHGE